MSYIYNYTTIDPYDSYQCLASSWKEWSETKYVWASKRAQLQSAHTMAITTLLHVASEWYSSLDQDLFIGFPNHKLLIHHLRKFGLESDACQWFTSYLSDRQHHPSINSEDSGDSPVMSGVPQGLVLGAFLSMFVNSLLAHLCGVITVLFADDTTLFIASHSVEDILTTLTSTLSFASDREWMAKTHVGHVQWKHCAVPPLLILTFEFSLVSPTGLAGSEEDEYQLEDKEPLYNCAHDLS